MTREEAAKILEKQFDESCGDYRYQNKDKLNYEDALWLAIAALREQREGKMGWISVKDRLPENDTRVLAYCKDRCIHDMKWRWADNAWYDKGSAAVYLANFVTHWLPLPELPKEGKQ